MEYFIDMNKILWIYSLYLYTSLPKDPKGLLFYMLAIFFVSSPLFWISKHLAMYNFRVSWWMVEKVYEKVAEQGIRKGAEIAR